MSVESMMAAAAAMACSFPLYKMKSSLQLGRGLPPVADLFKGVAEAVPLTGVVVGSQLLAKNEVKKRNDSNVASSLAVATFSSPFLVLLNGTSNNQSFMTSFKNMDRKQLGTTAVRELFFLSTLDDEKRDYPTTFALAASVNLVASPTDNYLTRLMFNAPATQWKDYAKGGPMRALFAGTFAVCYKLFTETFNGKA